MSSDFLYQSFLDNSILNIVLFTGILLLGLIFKKLISVRLSRLLFRFFKKYSEGVDESSFIALITKPLKHFVLLIFLFFAFYRLQFPEYWGLAPINQFGIRMIIMKSFQSFMIVSITLVALRIVDFLGLVFMKKAEKTASKMDDQLIPFVKEGLKILIGILGFFVILGSVFSLNISSLIAGLGIGGLAVALAAKETLENLLGSFTIFVDQPFVIGDLVKVGSVSGTVESIGFRSTRIRTLEKSFVTVPNKKMVDAETENLSMRTARRVDFNLHLSYSSTKQQLSEVVSEIRAYLMSHGSTDHKDITTRFNNFGTHSFDIRIDFYILTTDNAEAFAIREEINFAILELIRAKGLSFANLGPAVILPK